MNAIRLVLWPALFWAALLTFLACLAWAAGPVLAKPGPGKDQSRVAADNRPCGHLPARVFLFQRDLVRVGMPPVLAFQPIIVTVAAAQAMFDRLPLDRPDRARLVRHIYLWPSFAGAAQFVAYDQRGCPVVSGVASRKRLGIER